MIVSLRVFQVFFFFLNGITSYKIRALLIKERKNERKKERKKKGRRKKKKRRKTTTTKIYHLTNFWQYHRFFCQFPYFNSNRSRQHFTRWRYSQRGYTQIIVQGKLYETSDPRTAISVTSTSDYIRPTRAVFRMPTAFSCNSNYLGSVCMHMRLSLYPHSRNFTRRPFSIEAFSLSPERFIFRQS